MNAPSIPTGYLRNAQGHLVPQELVAAIDLTRDGLVQEIVDQARVLQEQMQLFKRKIMNDIAAFVELSAEQYDVQLGGNKGNVTLMSFDGRYKVLRAISEYITFDERLQAAKELIDQCIIRWAEGSPAEIRALVEHAFQADRQGKISTGRVLGLRQLDISDPHWRAAMQAITDSIRIVDSKSYVRIYERRGNTDDWGPISLDLAALPIVTDGDTGAA